MTESQSDGGAPRDSIDRRALPPGRQWRIAGLLTAVVAAGLLTVWLSGGHGGEADHLAHQAASPPGTFRATSQQLKSLSVESVGLHGFVSEELTEGKIAVNGDRATQVFSPYSGRVIRVIAGFGDTVKAGAPLATVEASEFVQAQNDLTTAIAQLKIARINESRKHALYDAKGGSLQDWQQAQADLTTAETTLESVRNRLRIFGRSDAEIDSLQTSRSMNPLAAITSPIAGVVVDRQIGPGQFLQAGAGTPAFTITDPSSVWLLANVREADAGRVRVGQAVDVYVLAYPKRAFKAHVSYVASLVDPATHRIPVRAEIANADGALKPEMFASFRIVTSDATESPAVPESAVIYEGDFAHVWVLSDDKLLTYRMIHTGRNDGGLVEIVDGLKANEQIVTKGGLFIDQVAVPSAT